MKTATEREQQLNTDFRLDVRTSAEQEIMISRAADRLVHEQRASTRLEAERLAREIYHRWKTNIKPKDKTDYSPVYGLIPPAHTGVELALITNHERRVTPNTAVRQKGAAQELARRHNLGLTPKTAIPHGTIRWTALKGAKAMRKHQLTIREAERAGCMLRLGHSKGCLALCHCSYD